MKQGLALCLIAVAVTACADVSPTDPSLEAGAPSAARIVAEVLVSNGNDSGPGSFRDAIELANADPSINTIGFKAAFQIELLSPVVFTGEQDLAIDGHNGSIDGSSAGGTAFSVLPASEVGDLSLIDIGFRDAPGEGVYIEVPGAATGVIKIALVNVDIVGNTGHGILVNDQLDPTAPEDTAGNALPADPRGSSASLDVLVTISRISGNGYSVSDRDGIRINEGGDGDLRFSMYTSTASGNAADGVELDERGQGSVIIDIEKSDFLENGIFDPADLDDGFDIDEANDGGISGEVKNSSASRNYEEGFDFNENDTGTGSGPVTSGSLTVNFFNVTASENGEEGIDLEEDDDFGNGGDLITVMEKVITNGNGGGDGGLKIREKQTGNLSVTLTDITSSQNVTSGIAIRESAAGNSSIQIESARARSNTLNGMDFLESGAGTLAATVVDSEASFNPGFGLFGDSGTVTPTNVKLKSNAAGSTGGTATFVQ